MIIIIVITIVYYHYYIIIFLRAGHVSGVGAQTIHAWVCMQWAGQGQQPTPIMPHGRSARRHT